MEKPSVPNKPALTQRESEVLAWMIQGKTDKEIAVILGNSPRTISQHVGSILKKLGVENRTAAVLAHQQPPPRPEPPHP